MSIIAQSPEMLVKRPAAAGSNVALNGSVNRNGDALARAGQNVAQWKTYLSDACVTAMMNAGWHWST